MKKNIPNILSLSRIPLGILFFYLYTQETVHPVWSLLVLLVSMVTDFFDGFLARKHETVSETGKWIDPISDFTFYLAVFLSFLMKELMPLLLFVLFIVRESTMYLIIRPLYVVKKLEVGAKTAGKVKTVLNGIGVVSILVFDIGVRFGIISSLFFKTAALAILSVAVAYSIISLYWYLIIFFRKTT